MNRELNLFSMGNGKLDFWRGRSDTAALCGHGFHNRSSLTPASDVSPRDICKYTLRTNRCSLSWLNLGEYENVDRYVNYH